MTLDLLSSIQRISEISFFLFFLFFFSGKYFLKCFYIIKTGFCFKCFHCLLVYSQLIITLFLFKIIQSSSFIYDCLSFLGIFVTFSSILTARFFISVVFWNVKYIHRTPFRTNLISIQLCFRSQIIAYVRERFVSFLFHSSSLPLLHFISFLDFWQMNQAKTVAMWFLFDAMQARRTADLCYSERSPAGVA